MDGDGGVDLVECKVCGLSCMLLSGQKKGRGGEKSQKKISTRVREKVVVALKVDMHCDKCAGMVRNAVRQFSGVEEVKDDGGLVKLIVVGEVDPLQLRAKVEEKAKTKVDLLSVSPTTTTGDKSAAGGSKPGTVVLRTLLYCESCVRKCKKIVSTHEGVQDVIIEKEYGVTYAITVTGTMDVDHLLRRAQSKLRRKVEAFNQPPAQHPPSQQAKKTDRAKEVDGKAKDIVEAEKAEVKKAKECSLGHHVDIMHPSPQRSDGNPNGCSIL